MRYPDFGSRRVQNLVHGDVRLVPERRECGREARGCFDDGAAPGRSARLYAGRDHPSPTSILSARVRCSPRSMPRAVAPRLTGRCGDGRGPSGGFSWLKWHASALARRLPGSAGGVPASRGAPSSLREARPASRPRPASASPLAATCCKTPRRRGTMPQPAGGSDRRATAVDVAGATTSIALRLQPFRGLVNSDFSIRPCPDFRAPEPGRAERIHSQTRGHRQACRVHDARCSLRERVGTPVPAGARA